MLMYIHVALTLLTTDSVTKKRNRIRMQISIHIEQSRGDSSKKSPVRKEPDS